jgi:hypothetical protein
MNISAPPYPGPDIWTPFLLAGVVFVLMIIIALFSQANRDIENDRQPVLTVPAHVIAKRTDTSGSRNYMSTKYYLTCELADGNRLEFKVDGHQYGLLVEGDRGMLKHQGTRFIGFERAKGSD